MHQLNKIGPEHIQRLGPEQLVRLLNLLLHAEARTHCFGKHGIHVPYQITVPDGGKDGQWAADIKDCEYIPRRLTYYQCKAQSMSDADCRGEILREDEPNNYRLKDKVNEVLALGGAYVFFCSHPSVRLDERIKATREALRDAGRPSPEMDCIDFLDANRIADWVNLHVSAFAYVCQQTSNFQAIGLKNIQAWKDDKTLAYDFQLNDYLKEQILNIRDWLCSSRSVARITGPSGLGKTRLGYEVFACATIDDNRVRQPLYGSVAYIDAQLYGQDVLGWIDQLCGFGFSGIVVVDNCPNEWHHKLTPIIRGQNSNLSMLTLDYVSESFHPGILHVDLNPKRLQDIVPKILRSVPELAHLQDNEIQRVSNFAQGFPQIAILTAQAGRALNLRDLNSQNKLAERLLWGRDAPEPQAREYIRCLSLFSFVGVNGQVKHQLEFVREWLCGKVSEYDFNKSIRRFKDARIIQEAGDFIMVTPTPLAVALAAEWLSDAPDDYILQLLPGIAAHKLTRPFCDQLHRLDFSEKARALSQRLMGANAPFASAEVLNSEVGSQVFRALAELNPLAATECLYRVFSQYTPEQMRMIKTGRRNLIWTLEKLCWSSATFQKAAYILMLFAGGEIETYANSATGQFKQLFHLLLSGTQCPAIERLDIIRLGLQSAHDEVKVVCIDALGSALESQYFSRTSGAEVRGTQLPEKDWEPGGVRDAWDYWKLAFGFLHTEIIRNGPLSEMALKKMANSLSVFLGTPLVLELEEQFKEIAEKRGGYWPAARKSITSFLTLVADIPQLYRDAINRWLSYVEPRDLKDRIVDVVCIPSWEHTQTPDGQYVDVAATRAEELAEQLYRENTPIDEFFPMLLQGEQNQAWAFGAKLATLSNNPQKLITQCLEILRAPEREGQNAQFLRGILSAVSDRQLLADVLTRVASDDQLRHLLVQLTTAIKPSIVDFDRVVAEIVAGHLSPHEVRIFAIGSVTSGFEDSQFLERLLTLVTAVPKTAPFILEIVNMHCFRRPEQLKLYRNLLERLLLIPELVASGPNSMFGHYWKENTKVILKDRPSDIWVKDLAQVIVNVALSNTFSPWFRDNVREVLEILLASFTVVAWPIFRDAAKNAEGEDFYRIINLLTDRGNSFQDGGSPLWYLPRCELRTWAQENAELAAYVLHFMSLYTVQKNPAGDEEFLWHPHAMLLMEIGKSDDVIGCVQANLLSFGSSGSRVPYLEKRIQLAFILQKEQNGKLVGVGNALAEAFEEALRQARKQDAHFAAGIY